MTLFFAFLAIVRRDLLLAFQRRAEMIHPLLFFVMVVSLFPLAIGAHPQLLSTLAPGILWVSALLAAMLSLDTVFRSDFEDGSLELLVLSPHPLAVLVLGKVCAHWLISGLPLVLIAPLLAELLGLSHQALPTLIVSLLLATPMLSLIGAIGVALTVGLRRGGMLLALLVLPLYVPVLIFASSAVDRAANGLSTDAPLDILTALLLLALSLAPWPTAAALKMSLQ